MYEKAANLLQAQLRCCNIFNCPVELYLPVFRMARLVRYSI